MKRASVSRLFRDKKSHHAKLLLQAVDSRENFTIALPEHKAAVLALEGHGLNDRCGLYYLLSRSVAALGGTFGSVIVTLAESGVRGVISLSTGGEPKWFDADVVELIALALHVDLPIYLKVADDEDNDGGDDAESDASEMDMPLPDVFEHALADILERTPLGGATESDGGGEGESQEDAPAPS